MPPSAQIDPSPPQMYETPATGADQTPRSARQSLSVPGKDRENGHGSPFRTDFSFGKHDRSVKPVSTNSDSRDGKHMMRNISRGAPGDAALMSMVERSEEETQQCRRKSSFYGDVFAFRESNASVRDKVARESMVMAEVKTNVIVCRYALSGMSRLLS